MNHWFGQRISGLDGRLTEAHHMLRKTPGPIEGCPGQDIPQSVRMFG